jgi:hypothetical protein
MSEARRQVILACKDAQERMAEVRRLLPAVSADNPFVQDAFLEAYAALGEVQRRLTPQGDCLDCGDRETAPGYCKTCNPSLFYPPVRCPGPGEDGHGCTGYVQHVPGGFACDTCERPHPRPREAGTEAS